MLRDGEPGFCVLVGGGLSSVPRIARDLGVFVRPDEAMPVLRAILDTWRDDLRWRVSRVKSRMKFMVDALGPEGVRAEVEQRLGYALPPSRCRRSTPSRTTTSACERRGDGRRLVGVPVHVGLLGGSRLVALGDLLEPLGAKARITRQQNLVLSGRRRPPRSTPSWRRSATSGSRSSSTGCAGTGSPARASRIATTR